jgi:nitronate monooxygenase/enoyl-[acyl-carrier protein] reductase II
MLRTKLCRDLRIEVPILSAPFGGGTAGPELAAAVSDAGGLGLLGMGGLPARLIREAIRATRARTSRPFGVGLLLPFVQGSEIDLCVEERVPVLQLFWGDVRPHVDKATRAGIAVLVQVGSVDEARDAAAAGATAVIAQGFEAGGHVRGTASLAAFLPAVVEAVQPLPVIAAGGIATGRGVVAALALGAEAAMMGTRFVCSEESRASRAYKERIVRARARDTVHTMLFDVGWPDAAHRVLRNKAIEEWEAVGRPPSGRRPGEGEIVGRMTVDGAMADVPRYFVGNPMTDFEGDVEYVALYAGESCELVNDVKPAGVIVRDVVREAEEILKKLAG